MRVIIPAAGLGSRLLPLTKSCPKGLIHVDGKSLLEHTLEQLYDAEVTEVVCVSGHHANLLESLLINLKRRPPLHFIRNPYYKTTNSIVSLNLTRQWWDESFCIIDSDVYFKPRLLQDLLNYPGDCMIIDNSRQPEQIDMKVEVIDGHVWHLDKSLPTQRTAGEFFGLSRWTPTCASHLAAAIDRLLEAGLTDVWYELAIRDAAKSTTIAPLYTDSSQWLEVDTLADLEAAEQFFNAK